MQQSVKYDTWAKRWIHFSFPAWRSYIRLFSQPPCGIHWQSITQIACLFNVNSLGGYYIGLGITRPPQYVISAYWLTYEASYTSCIKQTAKKVHFLFRKPPERIHKGGIYFSVSLLQACVPDWNVIQIAVLQFSRGEATSRSHRIARMAVAGEDSRTRVWGQLPYYWSL